MRRPAAPVRCVARVKREAQKLASLKHLRFFTRSPLRYSPPHNGGGRKTKTKDATPDVNPEPNKDALWRVPAWSTVVLVFGLLDPTAVEAGLSSAAALGSGRAFV